MIDKIAIPNDAAKAYMKPGNSGATPSPGEGQSFGDMVKNSIHSSIDTLRQGEAMAAKGITGEASTLDVVQAMNKADQTLQMVVSVRDRVIQAYQQIQRMQI